MSPLSRAVRSSLVMGLHFLALPFVAGAGMGCLSLIHI